MATTLGDLLDVLGDEATLRTDTIDPLDFVDADRALALLGRTLQRLVDDGLTTGGGTDRERWVGEAARASAGGAAAIAARPGRLAQLAGAADDVVALMRESLGCAQRWAIATAVVDAVGRLTALAERGDITDGRRRTLIVADASAIVVQRSAALDPPSALDSIPLDWAVPRPSPHSTAQLAVVVTEVVAGLEHATRPVGEPMSDRGLPGGVHRAGGALAERGPFLAGRGAASQAGRPSRRTRLGRRPSGSQPLRRRKPSPAPRCSARCRPRPATAHCPRSRRCVIRSQRDFGRSCRVADYCGLRGTAAGSHHQRPPRSCPDRMGRHPQCARVCP